MTPGPCWLLAAEPFPSTVGRRRDASWHIGHASIARNQAQVRWHAGRWSIDFFHLEHGDCVVRGEQVQAEAQAALQHGDRLHLGDLTFDVRRAAMPRQPELEAATQGAPHDPHPWRVYGDWLQEQGDLRGPFLARTAGRADAQSFQTFLDQLADPDPVVVNRRVGWLATYASRWPTAARVVPQPVVSAMFRDQPLPPETQLCRRLELVDVDLRAKTVGLQRLVRSPLLWHIEELDVSRTVLTGPMARLMARALSHQNLQRLVLSHNPMGPMGAVALAESSLHRLHTLELASTRLGDDGVQALADAEGLPALAYLDLRDNDIHQDGVDALAESAHLERLEVLDLRENPVASVAARRLERTGRLSRLRELRV